MSKKNVMIGLLAGAVAGALGAILMAPDKGSNTRKKIAGKYKETADGVKSGFKHFADTVVNKFSGATDGVSEKTANTGSSGSQVN